MCVIDSKMFNIKPLPGVRVTTAWPFLRFRKEEMSAMWRVAVNILNNLSRAADKGWVSSRLGVV
jgi:hypothetical protein